MQAIKNENGTTSVTTENGSYALPTALWEIFAECQEPTAVVSLVARARTKGFSNGYVRSVVQQLSQPGQYKGSACIGAINTSTVGKRLFVTIAVDGAAPARPKLTRRGSDTAAAQALASEQSEG